MKNDKATSAFAAIGIHAIRITSACLTAGILFSILPLARNALRLEDSAKSGKKPPVLVMQHIRKEEKKPEQQTRTIRSMSTSTKRSTSRSMGFSMRFAPILDPGTAGDGVGMAAAGSGGDAVLDESDVDEPPRPVVRTAIEYPRRARDAGIEGTVSLVLLISRNGSVIDVTVESAPSPLFIKPVEETVRQWKFTPARNQGIAVQVRMRQNITFKLDS
ncbi:MAG: energy transducer TonB [Chitinivibrionales bacterium]